MAKSLDALLDELYAAAPSEFMQKRDALAKEAADKDEARALKGRRKPTQAAYTLNQLARRNTDDVADLVDAGRALARAQRKALRGEKGTDLREAIERQRAVIRKLTTKAGELMRELGVAATGHLDEIAGALQAALVDPAVGEALEQGRLEKVPEPAASFAFVPVGEALPSGVDERAAEKRARERARAEREEEKERLAAEARRKRESEKERRQAAARLDREAKEERARAEARAKRDAKAKASAERAQRTAALRAERTRALEEAKQTVSAREAETAALEAKAAKIEGEARRLLTEAKQLTREAAASRRAASDAKKKLAALRRGAKSRAK